MNNEELKNKIIEILTENLRWKPFYFIRVGVAYEEDLPEIADTLIASGIGNVKAAEHRAEMAERALGLCEIAYILALNGKQHEGISQQAIVSDLGVHKFFIEQAEKELWEEGDE